jgi:putative membrane protein insertion efficiency factor
MTRVAIALILMYRSTLGQLAAGRCKYHPSCSQYAIDALGELGFIRGATLAMWRLVRCNPWSHGGDDYAQDQRLFDRHRHAVDARATRRNA